MADDQQTPPASEPGAGGGEDSSGSLMRLALLVALVAVIAAALVILRSGDDERKPQSNIPVNPDPKSLAAAGFVREDDGRFDPAGFGMAFDYPANLFEMLSPRGESSRDDETIGIEERRRHLLFADAAKDDADAQPAFRVIRVTYDESFSEDRLSDFREDLAQSPGDEPTEIKRIAGVPAFSRVYEAPGGSGSQTYFAANGTLYQLISFADRSDREAIDAALEEILDSVSFGD